MQFKDSYLGRLRACMGPQLLISVGARVLVEDSSGRFLITQRRDTGLWCLPGGAMELGESLADAVQRETFEETGLALREVVAFGLSSHPVQERHTYPNGDAVQNVSLLAHAFSDGTPRSNDGEAVAFRFVSIDEVNAETFVKTEFPTFGHYLRFRQSGAFQMV
jgi:8-oxo-dGTP pyrophosphatase MutT (NUDIX family)